MRKVLRGRAKPLVVLLSAMALMAIYPGVSNGNTTADDVAAALRQSQDRVEAINNTSDSATDVATSK